MKLIVVGVADCQVSNQPEATITTYALGSCIALAIHDPVAGVGGMLHFMLPESEIDRAKAEQNPYMFADTGIPLLFRAALQHGADRKRLTVRAAGGAQFLDDRGIFNIGKRNYLALRKILWKAGVMLHGEMVGGTVSRTVRLEIDSGKLWVREAGTQESELPAGRAVVGKEASNGVQRTNRG
jgi:chemotaxis protein CheD